MPSSSTVMAPSLTSSARSRRSYLDARDSRQDALAWALGRGHPATLFLALNIPGGEKTPPGAEALFVWMFNQLPAVLAGIAESSRFHDVLGPYAILCLEADPKAVKEACVHLETGHPSSRLIDLDVYGPDGRQIDRNSLGIPSRSCLICDQPAVDCIRAKRHSLHTVIHRVHELLAPFRT